jgi:ribonuclease E
MAAEPVAAEPVIANEPVAAIEVAPEPVPVPANIPATITAPAEPIDLSSELQKVGLQLIETSGKASAPVMEAPVQPLGRKPKPAPVLANEPLQMVETQPRQ